MLLLRTTIQPYAWGRRNGIADVVGSDPTDGPEAELWVGTHPAAPSFVVTGDDDGDGPDRTLAEVIAADPVRWLGPDLAAKGLTALPFLLKVLAIGRPLSLQAHPSADQAEAGFAREEAAGLARDAPERTYRDAGPKPEALVALAETWALCGFRTPEAAAALVADLGVAELAPLIERLRVGGSVALHDALAWLLTLDADARDRVVAAVAAAIPADGDAPLDGSDPAGGANARSWIARLAADYPGDATVVAPLLLQVVRLDPGDGVHLPAGNLHAYLHGAGVEIMAASDNVLRGGLTPKHIDVDELLAILRFEPGLPPPPDCRDGGDGTTVFDAHESSFGLVRVTPGEGTTVIDPSGPSLLLATDGPVDVAGPDGGLVLDHGQAAFVAPGEGPLTVAGPGRLWWATVGDALPESSR